MSFTTVDEATELANNTEFGLSGAVFGEDVERARKVAKALEVGAVGILLLVCLKVTFTTSLLPSKRLTTQ